MKSLRNLIVPFWSIALLSACAQQATSVGPGQGGTAPTPAYTAQFSSGTAASASCPSSASLGAQYNALIPVSSVEASKFDAAVLHYTNMRRCEAGVAPLGADPALRRAARLHSEDMAKLNFFSHTSPVPGRQQLPDRLKGGGISFLDAAENIAQRSRLQMISGRSFEVRDRATCDFAYGGQKVQSHSYSSLAQAFVQGWMDSPGHRKNLLDPRYKRLGSGGSFKANERNCGDIVATQNFAA